MSTERNVVTITAGQAEAYTTGDRDPMRDLGELVVKGVDAVQDGADTFEIVLLIKREAED